MKGKIFAVIVIILALLAAIWKFGIVLYDKGSQNAQDLNITNADESKDDDDSDKTNSTSNDSEDSSNLTEANYDETIEKNKDKIVIVDFYADWCGPCKKLSPILGEIEGENKDKYKVFRVDTDIETGLGMRFGIRYLPTLLIYKDGVMIDTTVGFMTKEELLDRLNKLNI